MRALFSLLLPLFLIGDILKVCNYNVENLFDLNLDGSEYIEFKDKKRWNSSSFNKKLKNISRVICDLDCDILALEEIENKNALKALLKILKDQNCNYPYYAITNNKNQAINSALISKVKILNSSSIKVDRGRLRSILEVSLNSSMPLKIFVNHWSSQKNGEEKRKIFAKALKNRLKELPKGSEYILIGDFNTDYKKSEVVGYSALDNILDTKLNGRYLRIRDKVNGFYHYNLWLELPYFKRWSYSFFGKKEALDAILIPPSLNDNRNWSYIKGSFGVFKRDYLFKNGYIKRWRMGKNGGGYSDHLPIYAYFKNNNPSFLERLQDYFNYIFNFKKEIKEPKIKEKIVKISFDNFLKLKKFDKKYLLEDVVLVLKRGVDGVITNFKKDGFIFLGGCADGMREGRVYDILVHSARRYKKGIEILDFDIKRKKELISLNRLIPKFDIYNFENYKVYEVIRDIKGRYKNGFLYYKGKKVKIYIKRRWRKFVKNGSFLNIKRALIGYYKGKRELFLLSRDDIKKER